MRNRRIRFESCGERVAKLRFTTRKQIRALAPHAKKLRFSTLANLSVKNPWRMSPDFSDFFEIGLRPKSLIDFCHSLTAGFVLNPAVSVIYPSKNSSFMTMSAFLRTV